MAEFRWRLSPPAEQVALEVLNLDMDFNESVPPVLTKLEPQSTTDEEERFGQQQCDHPKINLDPDVFQHADNVARAAYPEQRVKSEPIDIEAIRARDARLGYMLQFIEDLFQARDAESRSSISKAFADRMRSGPNSHHDTSHDTQETTWQQPRADDIVRMGESTESRGHKRNAYEFVDEALSTTTNIERSITTSEAPRPRQKKKKPNYLFEDEESDTEEQEPIRFAQTMRALPQYRPWTKDEISALESAIQVYGPRWANIRNSRSELRNRSTMQIRDKVRGEVRKRLQNGQSLGPYSNCISVV